MLEPMVNTSTMETFKQLSSLLDIMIDQKTLQTGDAEQSYNALVNSVLPYFVNKKLNTTLFIYNDTQISESIIAAKIFKAFDILFLKNPNLLSNQHRHLSIFKISFPFFNGLNCSSQLINDILFSLVKIISSFFKNNRLIHKRLLSQQRKYIFSHLDSLLNNIIKSFTNTDSYNIFTNNLNNNNKIQDLNLLSLDDLKLNNIQKISKISIATKILEFLIHPSINNLYLVQYQSSFILDSYISKCWFCLENIIVNVNFVSESSEIISLLDSIYSSLLSSTVNYYYNDPSFQFNRLQLALKYCHSLLNWPLLSHFEVLQLVLSQSLMRLTVNQMKLNNEINLTTNLSINHELSSNFNNLIKRITFPDLKKCLEFLFDDYKRNENFDNPDLSAYSKRIESLDKTKLDHSTKSINLKENDNDEYYLNRMLQNTAELYDSDDENFPKINFENNSASIIQNSHYIIDLGIYSCYLSGNYDLKSHQCKICDSFFSITNYIPQLVDINRPSIDSNKKMIKVYGLVEQFMKINLKTYDVNITISLLITLSRIFNVFSPPLLKNTLFDFLKACFTNPVREIRLLSVKIFPLFEYTTEKTDTSGVDYYNFNAILGYLVQFRKPDKSNYYIYEGYILCLAELLMVKSIDTRYYILLEQLIKFISDSDEFRSNMAIHALRLVAKTKNLSAWQIVEPYISLISIDIIKDRRDNPGLLINFCTAIDMEIPTFLNRTLKYTIPFLLTCYKEDHISFIAQKIGQTKSNLIKAHHEQILAYLLVTHKNIENQKIMNILSIYDPSYKSMSFFDLISSCQDPYFIYNLINYYEPSENNLSIIKDSLGSLSLQLNYSDDLDSAIQSMLNRWLLIVVQMITTTLNDKKGSNPFYIKIRAIRSITCLLKLCDTFDACLGQVITALQVALNSDDLKNESLICLRSIILSLQPKSVEFIFHSLLSKLLQIFDTFSSSNQLIALQIINLIRKNVSTKCLSYIFTLEKLPGLEKLKYEHLTHKLVILQFRNRLRSDNEWIIEQALDDLTLYIQEYNKRYQQMVKEDDDILNSFLSIIKILTTNLLKANNSNYDGNSNLENGYNMREPIIAYKAANLIGLLGNLDMNKSMITGTTQNSYDNVTNFLLVTEIYPKKDTEQYSALVSFSNFFLKNILVRSFVSSVNPDEQKFLAFVIQEYLRIFKFPTKTWDSLDDLTKNILEPLMTSRYKNSVKSEITAFPIYKTNKDYFVWLKELTANILDTCSMLMSKINKPLIEIESICSTIPLLDFSVSKFVLPYAVLFLVTIAPDVARYKKSLQEEFLIILKEDIKSYKNEVMKESLKKCVVSILELFQFLKAWMSKAKEEEESNKNANKTISKVKRTAVQRVQDFLNAFPSKILAERCIECDQYEGAILYLEKSQKEKSIDSESFCVSLRNMYVELEDYDELHGVLKAYSTNSLKDKLSQFKYNEDTQISNESLNEIAQYTLESNDTEESAISELLEALNKNCEYDQLLLKLNSFKVIHKERYPAYDPEILGEDSILYGIQAAIYTGGLYDIKEWTEISQESNLVSVPGTDLSIYYEIAHALLNLRDLNTCCKHVDTAVKYIGLAISNSNNILHKKLSDYMVLLHSLHDIKALVHMDFKDESSLKSLKVLKDRLEISKKDFKSIWKIHSLNSSVFRLHHGESQDLYIDSLIESCQILRENGKLPQATKMLTKALFLNEENHKMSEASTQLMNVEFSKLFWAQNNYETALKTLNSVIKNTSKSNPHYLAFNLTYLNWCDISAEGSFDEIRRKYFELMNDSRFNNSADIYYQYAAYLNKLLEAKAIEEADGQLDYSVIKNYILAVSYSKKYVHEIMPKAITLWLDFYQKYFKSVTDNKISSRLIDVRNNMYTKVNMTIEKCISQLGVKWYIVLSQILSRITHKDKKITEIISRIIIELTIQYPWILLYSVFSQARSVDEERRKIGQNILSKLQNSTLASISDDKEKVSHIPKIVASGLILLESIMSVCNATHKFRHPRNGILVKDLYKDLNFDYPKDSECLALGLPIKSNIDLLYNLKDKIDKKIVFYHRFHERVKILFSLQQPRRIKVTGSDGESYFLLFKPKDDLRKDSKVMEFSTVMNELLAKNFETETRNLQIKSFAATPLNETTGIIEWVQQFVTLRPIIDSQLKRKGISMNLRAIKADFGDAKNEDKLSIYESYLEKYPPVLGDWFIDNSPNISNWYNFRSQFTRSLAVMSIVGYLIGIGDRHLDNIMLNKQTGMIMHIDFDCMFEKGKKLSVPEIVPFRLTPNLVDAMGVLKYEGSFRKSCELTMSLIRDNENILMNFLESFIYDPLMDWKSNSDKNNVDEQRIKRHQEKVYKILRRKIRGILTKEDDNTGFRDSGGLSVSISLQVELLIQTAVNHENLSEMFMGWMPFL